MDFPTWIALGGYAGLGCALLAAGSVSLLALRLRRGSRQQIALASLIALLSCAFMLAPIWWLLRRFDVYGPNLGAQEVAFWLIWISLFGWITPLLTTAFFFALASPEPVAASANARVSSALGAATLLDDPARRTYPFGPDHPWGRLTPFDTAATAPPIDLSLEVTLIGRDPEDDIILDDDLVSRRHAEIRWRTGQAYLLDRGSLNGTLRNAQKARGLVPLEDGDSVQFGGHRYHFTLLAPASAEALEETRKVATSSASHPLNSATLALVGDGGALSGRRWELSERTTRIGRDPAAGVVIQDTSVSRFHAQITRQASGYYLADLDSSNGTQVNGEPVIEPRRIVAGDQLRMGEIVLRCEEVAPVIAPALKPELTAPTPELTAPTPELTAPTPDSATM